jgi:hypothetical protein
VATRAAVTSHAAALRALRGMAAEVCGADAADRLPIPGITAVCQCGAQCAPPPCACADTACDHTGARPVRRVTAARHLSLLRRRVLPWPLRGRPCAACRACRGNSLVACHAVT